jgi:ketosteroid isomerase-like protein
MLRREEMDTKAVLDHHLAAFSAGSVDEILKDYTDDTALITPDAVIKGREAIHAAYSTMFSGLFKPGTYDFTMDAVHVEGDVAYIAWRASCATAEVALGTDTFVVRNSKIVVQTFAAKIDPK